MLKLAGVGQATELCGYTAIKIVTIAGCWRESPGHLEFYFQIASKEPVTLFTHMTAIRTASYGARLDLWRRNGGIDQPLEDGGYPQPGRRALYPAIQFHSYRGM